MGWRVDIMLLYLSNHVPPRNPSVSCLKQSGKAHSCEGICSQSGPCHETLDTGHLFTENAKQHLVRWDSGWANVSSCYWAQLWHLVEEKWALFLLLMGIGFPLVLYYSPKTNIYIYTFSILIVVLMGFWTSQQKILQNTRTIIWKVTPPEKLTWHWKHHHFSKKKKGKYIFIQGAFASQVMFFFWGVYNYPPPKKKTGGLSQWPRSWDLKILKLFKAAATAALRVFG